MTNNKLKFHEGFIHPEFNHVKWYIRYSNEFYEACLDEFESQEHKIYWLENLAVEIKNEYWNKIDYGHYTEKSFETTKSHTLNILREKIEILKKSVSTGQIQEVVEVEEDELSQIIKDELSQSDPDVEPYFRKGAFTKFKEFENRLIEDKVIWKEQRFGYWNNKEKLACFWSILWKEGYFGIKTRDDQIKKIDRSKAYKILEARYKISIHEQVKTRNLRKVTKKYVPNFHFFKEPHKY